MNRKKIAIKIEPGQACVVADVGYLTHIAELYKTMSEDSNDPEDKAHWLIVAELVTDWIDKTHVPFEEEIYE